MLATAAAEAAKKVRVHPGTLNPAELIKTVKVGTSFSNAVRRTAFQLTPNQIPNLAQGDKIIVPAEMQVTTRCDIGQVAPGCDYDPTVRAFLMITGQQGDKDPSGNESKKIGDTQELTCTKMRHHCLFTFRRVNSSLTLTGAANVPCVSTNSCYINLVVFAANPNARPGGVDKLLIGENEGNYLANGEVGSDLGRLMIIRTRDVTASDSTTRQTDFTGEGSIDLPTNAQPRVIYSHRLKQGDLVVDEQFYIDALVKAHSSSRARLSTKLVVSKNPNSTSNTVDHITPTGISEKNGQNCNGGCSARKVGVFRVTGNFNAPVYVNVVATSAVPGGGSTDMTIKNQGHVQSVRWSANLLG